MFPSFNPQITYTLTLYMIIYTSTFPSMYHIKYHMIMTYSIPHTNPSLNLYLSRGGIGDDCLGHIIRVISLKYVVMLVIVYMVCHYYFLDLSFSIIFPLHFIVLFSLSCPAGLLPASALSENCKSCPDFVICWSFWLSLPLHPCHPHWGYCQICRYLQVRNFLLIIYSSVHIPQCVIFTLHWLFTPTQTNVHAIQIIRSSLCI